MAERLAVTLRINTDGTAAVTGIKKVTGELERFQRSSETTGKKASSSMGMLNSAVSRLGITVGGLVSAGALGKWFVGASVEADRLTRSLTAVTGSSAAAGAEMAYIRDAAERMGLQLGSAAGAYLSLSAAAKGTALEGQRARDIFEAVALAMGKLGKSAYDTEGALLAIEQMISKGTVQAEELRGQLGERLPGAFQAAARAMDVTTEELGKLLQTGQVTAEQLLPKLAAELNRLYDDGSRVGGLTVEWNRFTSAMSAFAASANEATGATGLLERVLRGATSVAGDLKWALDFLRTGENPDRTAGALGLGDFGLENLRQEADALYSTLISGQAELIRLTEEYAGASGRERRGALERLKAERAVYLETAQRLGEINTALHQKGQEAERAWKQNRDGAAAAAEAAKDYGEVLTGEAAIVADLEQQYGLLRGQLDAIWKLESNRGKTAGVDSSRLVKDLAAGKGAVTEIVGEFQMARATAQGLGADMSSFKGQAEGAAKYLQEAAQKGLNLWEQFAYYHGGPNKAAWGERTKAYADQAVKLVEQAGGAMRVLGESTAKAIERSQSATSKAMDAAITKARLLARQYIPGRAAAEDYAEAQWAVAAAVEAQKLSTEEAAQILEALKKEQSEAAQKAAADSSSWGKVWEATVERIDNAFADLWVGFIDGSRNAMDTVRAALQRWLAEMAHMLITQPLTARIGAAVGIGGSGTAAAGTTATGGGGLSLSGIGSWVGGNSMGQGMANTAMDIGASFGNASFAAGAYSKVAQMPNWQVGSAGLVGGVAGGYVASQMFEGEYVSIGSSIGSAVGAAAAPMITAALGMGPIGWAGLAVGSLFGAIGGGGIGSLFGGKKEDPRITLGMSGGAFHVQGANGPWGDVGPVFESLERANAELQAIAEALGPGAQRALSYEGHGGQDLTPENMEQWIADLFDKAVKAMAQGARDDEFAKAGSRMMSEILTSAFEAAGDDPQAMIAAIGAAKALHDMLFYASEMLFDFDTDPAIKSLEQGATALWAVTQEMRQAGEGMADTLDRVSNYLKITYDAFELAGQSLEDIKLSPEQLVKEVSYQVPVEGATGSQKASPFAATIAGMYGELQSQLEKEARSGESLISQTLRNTPLTAGLYHELEMQLAQGSVQGDWLVRSLRSNPLFGRMFTELENQMVGAIPDPGMSIEKLMAKWKSAYQSVAENQQEFVEVVEQVALTEQEIAEAIVRMRAEIGKKLAEYAGGEDVLQAGMATYYDRFYTEAEKTARMLRQAYSSISEGAAELGMTVNPLQMTKEGIRNFVESLNLTTEEGQRAFATVMRLSGELAFLTEHFEGLADVVKQLDTEAALTISAFMTQIKPPPDGEESLKRMAEYFASIGVEMPATTEALYALMNSGQLTAQQMLDLAQNSEIVLAALAHLNQVAPNVAQSLESLLTAAMSQLTAAVNAEKEAINATYQDRIDGLNAEKEAANAAHAARMEALQAELQAAQESVQIAEGLLSTIRSALDTMRSATVDEFSRTLASAQLAAFARGGALPDQDTLSRVLQAATSGAPEQFTSATAYAVYQKSTLANLLALEAAGVRQVDAATRAAEGIESQIELAEEQHAAYIEMLDRQIEQAADWRDREIARLDEILANAQREIEIALGTYQSAVSIEVALAEIGRLIREAYPDGPGGTNPAGYTPEGPYVPGPGVEMATAQAEDTRGEMLAEVRLLRETMQQLAGTNAVKLKSIDDRLLKWDYQLAGDAENVTLLRAG